LIVWSILHHVPCPLSAIIWAIRMYNSIVR